MREFERDYYEMPTNRRPPPVQKRHGPLAVAAAMLMLALGAIFSRLGAFCTAAAQRSTDAATVRTWTHAVKHFQGEKPGTQLQRPNWERQLLHFGSPILIGIGTTFILMWLLLLLGGTLFWLVTHGFGLLMLLGALTIGTVIGAKTARLGRYSEEQEWLN